MALFHLTGDIISRGGGKNGMPRSAVASAVYRSGEPNRHEPNTHCHLMLTMRPFNEHGEFVKEKCKRVYKLDENGEKILNKKGTDYIFDRVNIVDWDNKENMEIWREK